ncbi:probable membrane-associated kinase regulator 6 [Actinidia eriantha]|uniref:probable membrane-associated kinase regulator 6 n=1 Tax=Actinidia eriantha TaxID=165200 RepID=UPI00258F773B|nr:probable membrane-associated kinase regulator 6 [Actinidia eriantha]
MSAIIGRHLSFCAYPYRLAAMETSQSLSIESFSYSWLVNIKPSFDSLLDDSLRTSIDASDEASFIEMDPKLPASKRFFIGSQDFHFDFPISQSPLTPVHADELISNGFLIPLFVKSLKMEAFDTSDSIPTTPISSHIQNNVRSASKLRCLSLRRCHRLSKRIFQKYLEFIMTLCRKLQSRRRSGSRTEAADTRMQKLNKWIIDSPATSPRTSATYSVGNWRGSCDSESSINEAILHCKRSIGK